MGTHLIDTMSYYAGKVGWVYGNLFKQNKKDPTLSGMIHFAKGIEGFIVPQGKRENLIFEIDILGSAGRIRILDNGRILEYYRFEESKNYSGYRELKKVKEWKRTIFKENPFIEAVEDIVLSIQQGKKPLCSGEDGLNTISVVNALIKSVKSNKRILIKWN